jgi:hypothetical protein
MTRALTWLFPIIAVAGVVLDMQNPPSRWRFILWTVSNAGNLMVLTAVYFGWIERRNSLPAAALFAIYLVLAIVGTARCFP